MSMTIRRRLKIARQINCTDQDLTHAIRVCFMAGVVTEAEATRAIVSYRQETARSAK